MARTDYLHERLLGVPLSRDLRSMPAPGVEPSTARVESDSDLLIRSQMPGGHEYTLLPLGLKAVPTTYFQLRTPWRLRWSGPRACSRLLSDRQPAFERADPAAPVRKRSRCHNRVAASSGAGRREDPAHHSSPYGLASTRLAEKPEYDWQTVLNSHADDPYRLWSGMENELLSNGWDHRTGLPKLVAKLQINEPTIAHHLIELGLAADVGEVVDRLGATPGGSVEARARHLPAELEEAVYVLVVVRAGRPITSLHHSHEQAEKAFRQIVEGSGSSESRPCASAQTRWPRRGTVLDAPGFRRLTPRAGHLVRKVPGDAAAGDAPSGTGARTIE